MANRWEEALTGTNRLKAHKIIVIEHPDLNDRQREALWKLWDKIGNKGIRQQAQESDWWQEPKQEKLINIQTRTNVG